MNPCISASFVDIYYLYGEIEEVFRTLDVKTPKQSKFSLRDKQIIPQVKISSERTINRGRTVY